MSNRGRRVRRLSGSFAVVAMLVTFVPMVALATAASAAAPAPQDISAFCAGVDFSTPPFPDVTDTSSPSYDAIACAKAAGIVEGKTDGLYHPSDTTSRAQMASLLARQADESKTLDSGSNITALPAAGSNPFVDVGDPPSDGGPSTAPHTDNILRLVAANITQGTDSTHFSPANPVTRFQMAKFEVAKLEFITGTTLDASCGATFNDGAETDPTFGVSVEKAACAGIVQGDTSGNYNGSSSLSRAQTAIFDIRGMAYELSKGFITPLNGSHQAISASPSGETLVTFVPTAEAGTGTRTQNVTFSGLDDTKTYNVALFPCATPDNGAPFHGNNGPQVVVSGGSAMFRDADTNGANGTPDGLADNIGETADGDITMNSINGVPPGNNLDEPNLSPENGQFLVNLTNATSTDNGDCAFLVAFQDANSNGELDLHADNTPSEAFGVSGPLVWTSHEAPTGTGCGTCDVVWKDGNTMYLDDPNGYSMIVKSTDTPVYDDNTFAMTPAEFAKATDVGDEFDFFSGNYSQTAPNVFDLGVQDSTDAPSNVAASQGNFDSQTVNDDVKLTWTRPADSVPGEITDYEVFRDGVSVGTTGADVTQFVDSDVAPGTYSYRVQSTTENGDVSDLSEPISFTVVSPTGGPKSISATALDTDASATLTSGDVLTVVFDKAMDAPGAGDKFTTVDADGTGATVICGTNANCVLGTTNLANDTITYTLTAAPVLSPAGTVGGEQFPNTVASSTGNTDATNHIEWDVAGSTDKTFS